MLKITKNQGSIQVTADKSGFYPFDGTITFPTNSLFTATSANTDMITFKSTSNGDVQFVGNYKDITISGRSYDTKQKFLTAFSNLANQGSVDAYTKAETDEKLKNKLTAQTNAKGALFISSSSNDDASSSVALYNSSVNGTNDVAIGWAATNDKEGLHNLAILNKAQAHGTQNIAIGDQRRCYGIQNVGIGCGKLNTVDVIGAGNVCIGASSQAHTDNNTAVNNSIAIGSSATTSSNYCTVIGNSANSKSSHAVAIGDGAYVEHDCDSSVAVGDSARAYGKGSVAIGTVSYADNDKPLDICCGQRTDGTPLNVIQSDANGKISLLKGNGTDERMVIQDEIEALKNAGGGGTVDAYTKAETDAKIDAKQGKLKAGNGITLTEDATDGTTVVKTAVSLTDNGYGVYTVGDSIKIDSDSVAIGYNASADIGSNVVIGGSASSNDGYDSVAVGYGAQTYGEGAVAIGFFSKATDNKPLVIRAGKKTVGNSTTPLTVLQSDSNGKLSILKGDGTDERIVIQDALSAGGSGGGGTVDAYTKAETDNLLNAKQNTLTAGTGITIDENNVISSTGGSGGSANPFVNVKGTSGDATIADNVTDGIAIGSGATSANFNSIVIGNDAGAFNNDCIVIGGDARSFSYDVVVVGHNAYIDANSNNSVAVGYGAQARGESSVAIGDSSLATVDKPLEICCGKTVNGDSLRVLQSDSTGKLSILKGDGTDERIVIQDALSAGGSGGSANPLVNVKGTGSATIPDNVTEAVAIGGGAKVTEELSVAIGAANALSGHCVAIGGGANATKMSSVAIGDGACATAHMFDVAIGFHAATTDTKPLEINAGYKTVGGSTQPLTVLQSDANGKISIIKGDNPDERIVISDEITALKAEITTLKAEIAALKGGTSTGA